MPSTNDTRAERAVSLIHDADALGFFASADPALLAPLAHALAAEAVLGNLDEVAEVAAAHHIPAAGVALLAQAGMIAYFPTTATIRRVRVGAPPA
ncbi:hypothetical protein [Microbacterium sp. RG1]|uniref:hypothetical protein n=1 Tax=Microbacterium sp. RG1 TaxID=2489212 RepID=UPI0010CA24E5|nr:hypothetical protein [Microbacterium sp. RG1]QCQ15458.1 hypothetical protein EHF32_01195 [Microbacterium sp. RG1]